MDWDRFDRRQIIKGINDDNREINRKLSAIDKGRPLSSESKEELISLLNANNKIKNKYMDKPRDIRILDDPKAFFDNLTDSDYLALLDEMEINYELKDGVKIV